MKVARPAIIDRTKLPPNEYLVAHSCPKLLEGHAFYACQMRGPSVSSQDKPSIIVSCEFLVDYATICGPVEVICGHGGERASGSGVQFGIPTVSHVERYPREVDDGSTPD